ncbi:MAG: hypothetical protein J7L69_04715 [Desulfobulbaceae bacterium]|nr:hypothetical protein [Desulfobulbaceae bacterium]
MKIEKLSNLCDIVIGRTPARKERKYWGKGSKWVSISDLKSKNICETKEEITSEEMKPVEPTVPEKDAQTTIILPA